MKVVLVGLTFLLLSSTVLVKSEELRRPSGAQRFPRIVGGVAASPHEFPFLVSIRIKRLNENHYCGGSIINVNYVITAAHCVFQVTPADVVVLAGAYRLSEATPSEESRLINRIAIHPKYDDDTEQNDIALLNMVVPFFFGSDVQPIQLATEMDAAIFGMSASLVVSGWGVVDAASTSRSDIPRKVRVPIVPNEICQAAYQPLRIFSSNLCAGYLYKGGADACRGDSGGPLFLENPPSFLQIGIVSWGNSCALAGYPGVYTKVSYFIPWIASNAV